jgi:hypothetical protein
LLFILQNFTGTPTGKAIGAPENDHANMSLGVNHSSDLSGYA